MVKLKIWCFRVRGGTHTSPEIIYWATRFNVISSRYRTVSLSRIVIRMDYDDEDEIVLAPALDLSLPAHRPYRSPEPTTFGAGGARPNSPIQIDEEVVVKNKRQPRVKLIDRYSLP
jgi:hypothetical protein